MRYLRMVNHMRKDIVEVLEKDGVGKSTGKEVRMIKQYFLLFSCNEWKEYSSMRLVGISMDLEIIYIMIGSKIKSGDMLYQSDDKKESWKIFQRDYRLGAVELAQLEYGFVDTYEEYNVLSQEFAEAETVRKIFVEKQQLSCYNV